jgi:N-acetylglucosamine kinase
VFWRGFAAAMEKCVLVCFDIGGSHIKSAWFAAADDEPEATQRPTPADDYAEFIAAIAAIAGSGPERPAAAAIALTGVIDPETGLLKCANIPCLDGKPLARDLASELGFETLIANDADCFALAEATFGAGRGHRNVFGVILGSGVGGALVIDGRIVEGAGGYAGEWGHGRILCQQAGTPPMEVPAFTCGCGQSGCVNTIGGARGLERLYGHVTGHARTSTEILAAWGQAEPQASRVLDIYLDLVSGPLALTLNVTGSSVVPVGGGLSGSAELLAALDQRVRARLLRKTDAPVLIKASLSTEPGLVGAAILGFGTGRHGQD